MPTPIPTAQHPTLKKLINETYTDGVESILDARLEDDGVIIAVARDEDRIIAFKYTDDQVSVRVLNPEVIEGGEAKVDADTFTPAPSNDDFQNLSSLLAAFDWDEVRSIAEEQRWAWDDEAGRYRDSEDKLVTSQQILEVTQAELAQLEDDIEEITTALVDGVVSVAEWDELIAESFISAALLFLLFGLGDRTPNASTEDLLRTELERQFGFLQSFAQSVLNGDMTAQGIASRAKLYVHDAQLMYSRAQEIVHPVELWPYVRNVLGSCNHCAACTAETQKEWVLRGDMSMPGTRICKVRCCCQLVYGKTSDARIDEQTGLGRGYGWLK